MSEHKQQYYPPTSTNAGSSNDLASAESSTVSYSSAAATSTWTGPSIDKEEDIESIKNPSYSVHIL